MRTQLPTLRDIGSREAKLSQMFPSPLSLSWLYKWKGSQLKNLYAFATRAFKTTTNNYSQQFSSGRNIENIQVFKYIKPMFFLFVNVHHRAPISWNDILQELHFLSNVKQLRHYKKSKTVEVSILHFYIDYLTVWHSNCKILTKVFDQLAD